MTRRNTSGRSLTELQQAILDFVWENGPVTADQVRQALEPKYPLKDPTIRTMLRRLEARAYVTHRTEGKVFMYRAKVHSLSVAATAVKHIIQRFCAGSAEQFLLGMVDEDVLSKDEIQRLAKKIQKQK
jgi:BlaI family transcriptional regulator, penicillinase repressor